MNADGPVQVQHGPATLSGRTVLVTGASRGLGRAMSLGFAEAGANLVLASRRLDACEEVAEEVRRRGAQALPVAAHVGHWEELPGLVDAAYERFGSIDVLVNNAGSSPVYDSLEQVSEQLFDSTIALNFKGPFRLAVLVAEGMRRMGGGSIINISSLSAVRPEARALPYAAAKMALDVVTMGLAQEFAPTVRVNSIRPGSFATTVSEHWTDEQRAAYAHRVALGRVAEPGEIVGAALYLASAASSFTTGSVISVDGGAL